MKYECNYCGDSLKPCVVGHDDRRPVELLGICPFRRYAKPRWKQVSDKPDPHVVTSADEGSAGEPQADGDEIVKLAKSSAFCDKDDFVALHRLIQAGIQNNNRLFTGLYEKFGKIQQRSLSNKENLKDLKTEIEADILILNLSVEDLERKVEELEKSYRSHLLEGHKNLIIRSLDYDVIIDRKPQAKGGVAQAPDEKGKMHDLIPGVSVYWYGEGSFEKLFHHCDGEYLYGYAALNSAPKLSDEPWTDERGGAIWLRDLSFLPFAKAQDVGGDK